MQLQSTLSWLTAGPLLALVIHGMGLSVRATPVELNDLPSEVYYELAKNLPYADHISLMNADRRLNTVFSNQPETEVAKVLAKLQVVNGEPFSGKVLSYKARMALMIALCKPYADIYYAGLAFDNFAPNGQLQLSPDPRGTDMSPIDIYQTFVHYVGNRLRYIDLSQKFNRVTHGSIYPFLLAAYQGETETIAKFIGQVNRQSVSEKLNHDIYDPWSAANQIRVAYRSNTLTMTTFSKSVVNEDLVKQLYAFMIKEKQLDHLVDLMRLLPRTSAGGVPPYATLVSVLLLEAGYVGTAEDAPQVPVWLPHSDLPMKDMTRETLNGYLSPVLDAGGRSNMQCAELYGINTAAAVLRRSLAAYRQRMGITNVRDDPMPPSFCRSTLYDTRYFHFARRDNEVHFYVRTSTDDLTPEQRAALTPVSSDKVPFSSFGPVGAEDTIPEDEFTAGKVTHSEPALRILRKF